jgi:hypothetical protein
VKQSPCQKESPESGFSVEKGFLEEETYGRIEASLH